MDAIKKQASKLKGQVAKQQQALLKQIGRFGTEAIVTDEEELQRHQQLQDLYLSTRTAKHYQKDIVRDVQGFVSVSSKQMEIIRKLAKDCRKYGAKEGDNLSPFSQAAICFGSSRSLMENERETLLSVLSNQLCEPLRALVNDSRLEDARLLVRHYERLWQEAENQAIEVARQQSKLKDGSSGEDLVKLRIAEAKLEELKSRLMALGKEARSAMLSVETHQQRQTFEQLLMMVEAERSYHHRVLTILDNLLEELISSAEIEAAQSNQYMQEPEKIFSESYEYSDVEQEEDSSSYFIAKVVYPFDALEEGELSLSVDDFVVVYKVVDGWCKGEHKGQGGWFPSAYVERVEVETDQSSSQN